MYYTMQEVSEILKCHLQTVKNWVYSGKLKSVKIAELRRIKKDDLEEFINDTTNKAKH